MPTIYVENKPYKVGDNQNLLQACLSLGFDIPYFCWHPAMKSVGACRLCAVKQFRDEKDIKGRIVMSCMTPASEGVRISIKDPEAMRFRKSVIEWLMTNHPQDCPVCDEGGECHLQDMTLLAGQIYRRYRFEKRTHRNQYLGPFVRHEMNRCIQCYRCVRFYCDYAGGRDFGVFCWRNKVYFGRHKEGILQSRFSGNLVEVCPTGVFTDKTFAGHFTRKWDLQTAPSICPHCGLGCNTIPGERYGMLRRIHNRFNSQVNGYFLCDRGRFGSEFVNSERRIIRPLCRKSQSRSEPTSKKEALTEISQVLKNSKGVIGIGSPRASLESNYALSTLVGAENFYAGVSSPENEAIATVINVLQKGPVRSASMHDVAASDAVLILGEDVSNTAPMLELALRQSVLKAPAAIAEKLHIEPWNDTPFREAVQEEKGPLYIAACNETLLDGAATMTYHAAPGDLARFGFAVAHELDAESPEVENLPDKVRSIAKKIATDLKNAQNPIVIAGTSCQGASIIESAANVAYALFKCGKKAQLCFTCSCCNSVGLSMFGAKSFAEAVSVIERGLADTVIILENDIYRNIGPEAAERIFKVAKNVIAIDCLNSRTTDKANFVLPAATFAESDGTFVNNEGRAQRFFKVFKPAEDIQDGWRWIQDIFSSGEGNQEGRWETFDDIVGDLAHKEPVFEPIVKTSPSADFRMCGRKIPRQLHRASGRTAMYADKDVREHQMPEDPDSPLSFSMEGYDGQAPSSLITHFWAPWWNSVQSVTKFQSEAGGELRGGDPGVRLFEPKSSAKVEYFREIPDVFESRDGEFLIMPGRHIFGSEELSSRSVPIAELAVKPYLAVNPSDAENLEVNGEGKAQITLSKIAYFLPVKTTPAVPRGVAVVPMGLSELQWDGVPIRLKLKRKQESK